MTNVAETELKLRLSLVTSHTNTHALLFRQRPLQLVGLLLLVPQCYTDHEVDLRQAG